MFNLLMFNEDWASGKGNVWTERMFENTDDHIIAQFKDKERIFFQQLILFPCLFSIEGKTDEIARVGRIVKIKSISNTKLSLEISFDKDVPPLNNSLLFEKRTELEIEDFEFSRNHWAIKDIDIYQFLLRNVRPRRQHPTVFNISVHENIDPKLTSVMMPFDASFNQVYSSIKQAADDVGLSCRRADDIWESASIIQDVVALIDRSRIVICDCSGRNPNVFYEAGIAHTLGRDVILITQNQNDIPFDLRHLRFIHYLNNSEGLSKLKEKLMERIQTLLGH